MQLRILTHNVQMLPGLFGSGDADIVRASKLGDHLRSAVPAYDFICLQEVFDEEARAVFVQKLGRYALVPKVGDGDVFDEDSGLFFASRYAIQGFRFGEFKDSMGDDSWSDKGIFGARIGPVGPEGVSFLIFNTHLQADYRFVGEHTATRRKQINAVSGYAHLAILRSKVPSTVALLMGDLNVVATSNEYADVMRLLNRPRDLFAEANPGDPGFTVDGFENQNMMGPQERNVRRRIDYLLAFRAAPTFSGKTTPLRAAKVVSSRLVKFGDKGSRLSDHFGVEAILEV